ncbi:hypothetical protein JVU11DRAFT_12587 [Chiua virens]|nr:hypothetical protein JVU11DRAFT_12587 [Chiua virens]
MDLDKELQALQIVFPNFTFAEHMINAAQEGLVKGSPFKIFTTVCGMYNEEPIAYIIENETTSLEKPVIANIKKVIFQSLGMKKPIPSTISVAAQTTFDGIDLEDDLEELKPQEDVELCDSFEQEMSEKVVQDVQEEIEEIIKDLSISLTLEESPKAQDSYLTSDWDEGRGKGKDKDKDKNEELEELEQELSDESDLTDTSSSMMAEPPQKKIRWVMDYILVPPLPSKENGSEIHARGLLPAETLRQLQDLGVDPFNIKGRTSNRPLFPEGGQEDNALMFQLPPDLTLTPATNKLISHPALNAIQSVYLKDYDLLVCQHVANGEKCCYAVPLVAIAAHGWSVAPTASRPVHRIHSLRHSGNKRGPSHIQDIVKGILEFSDENSKDLS